MGQWPWEHTTQTTNYRNLIGYGPQLLYSENYCHFCPRPCFPWVAPSQWLRASLPGRHGTPLMADFVSRISWQPCWTVFRMHGDLGCFYPIFPLSLLPLGSKGYIWICVKLFSAIFKSFIILLQTFKLDRGLLFLQDLHWLTEMLCIF